MKIRAMTKYDRPIVQEIIHSAGVFTAEEGKIADELVDTYLSQPDEPRDYEVEVVENNTGTVAGFICYGPTSLTEGAMDIYWLAVHAGSQRQGFGKALLGWLEKTAAARKTRLIVIETSSSAPYSATRLFYERMGYVEQARIPHFYRPGDDRVIYVKYFPVQGFMP